MITHTISIIELLWSVIAIIGTVFAFYVVQIVFGNYIALQRDPTYIPDGPRAFYARGRIRTELVKLFVMLSFVAIGVVAMTQPPAHDSTLTPSTITIATALIMSSLLMSYDSVLYILNRDIMMKLMKRTGIDEDEH